MTRRLIISLVALAALASIVAFVLRPRSRPPAPAAAVVRLEGVEFSGCASVLVGPVCEIDGETRLSLWVPGDPKLTAATDGSAAPLQDPRPVDGGLAFRVTIPRGSHSLTLSAASQGTWSLQVAEYHEPEALRRARALRTAGKDDEARRVLEEALQSAPTEDHGRIHGLLARIALEADRISEARRHFSKSIATATRAQRMSDAGKDALALAYTLSIRTEQLVDANQSLDTAARIARDDAEVRANLPYYRGLVEANAGNLRGALVLLRTARRRARRLQMEDLVRIVTQQEAFLLADMGQPEQAVLLERPILNQLREQNSCQRSDFHMNFAWVLVRAGHTGSEARSHVERGLADLRERCDDPFRRMHAHLVAAFLALENRNLDSAAREIQLADAIGPARPAMKLWQVDLAARLALLRDEAPQALTLYEEETKLARNSGARPESWRGLLGQAQALSLLKRKSAAVKVLEQAEQVLDETLLRVPLAEGRGRFLTDRESTSRKLVALYLDLRRPRDAYRAARRARARVLRAAARVDRIAELAPSQAQKWKRAVGRYLRARTALERESAGDWELPADRLAAMQQARRARTQEIEAALDEAYALVPQGQASQETPPAPGSVRLLYFPRDSGWVGFCETPSGLSVARIASPLPKSPVALAQSLLSPFHEQLEGAEALVFYPYGALASVDFHGLPWNGHLLVDELRVSYGLDLGRDEGGADSRQSVLIVADPSGDLPHARQEGRRVEAAFGAPRATVLEGPAATRADVLERLPHAGLFHYAGHGTFAGPTGGESSLALASGAEVRVGDILALSRVPRFVVLSACEAARTDRGARPESLGVAQAFVTRGAEAVIAPTRPVADDLAAALMRELYAHPAEDLVTSLTRAQRTLDKARPDSDWAAYRVLVP